MMKFVMTYMYIKTLFNLQVGFSIFLMALNEAEF